MAFAKAGCDTLCLAAIKSTLAPALEKASKGVRGEARRGDADAAQRKNQRVLLSVLRGRRYPIKDSGDQSRVRKVSS